MVPTIDTICTHSAYVIGIVSVRCVVIKSQRSLKQMFGPGKNICLHSLILLHLAEDQCFSHMRAWDMLT